MHLIPRGVITRQYKYQFSYTNTTKVPLTHFAASTRFLPICFIWNVTNKASHYGIYYIIRIKKSIVKLSSSHFCRRTVISNVWTLKSSYLGVLISPISTNEIYKMTLCFSLSFRFLLFPHYIFVWGYLDISALHMYKRERNRKL